MATKPEIERLAVLETKVDQQGKDINEMKIDVREIKSLLLKQNETFITKKSIVTWITLATAAIIAVIAVANYVTGK